MEALDNIVKAAIALPQSIVLPEGQDARIVEAALKAQQDNIAKPVLLGRKDDIAATVESLGQGSLESVDPATSEKLESYAQEYYRLRQHKGISMDDAINAMQNPINFAAMMVHQGDAGGTLGGATTTTADLIRSTLQIIGQAPDVSIVSSFFLMMLCEPHHPKQGAFVFADCGLVVEPNQEELAQIAISSAKSFHDLTGLKPHVAMLSFSTRGSARHHRVTTVNEAAKLVKNQHPDLIIEGDIQFDAAFIPAVNEAKVENCSLKGEANVFIFPNLDAGNIGYKIAQRIGNVQAIGPILQGLAKPSNDLSRGCSIDDIYYMLAITSVQAQHSRETF